jgi:hypothetical protein
MYRLGKRAATAATVLALGGFGVVAPQVAANASTFSAPYTCNVPIEGNQSVTINGSLTATPNPAAVNTSVSFDLHVTSISISVPVTINSWSATADIDATGAQSASFNVKGSGGSVASGKPITGDLKGNWTPTAKGTDSFQGGNVSITANISLLGNITVPCTPKSPRPVGETLTVH